MTAPYPRPFSVFAASVIYGQPVKRAPKARKITETQEHKTIADFFAIGLGGSALAMHIRNERAGVGERIKAVVMGIFGGAPDWLILDGGRAIFIELKPRGWKAKAGITRKYTDHEMRQLDAHRRIRLAHCPVEICETLEDVIAFLEHEGVPLRVRAA